MNDETSIMNKLADALKAYPAYYTDANVALVNYDMLNSGVEHGIVIIEGTITNPQNAKYAYMGAGQHVVYTFDLQCVRKVNRKKDESDLLRADVSRVRTIIDADHTLGSTVDSCRITSAASPGYLLRDGNGPYYRYRTLTAEVSLVEALDLLVETAAPTPLTVPVPTP